MKKILYSYILTILMSLSVYGQIPNFTYSVMEASTECETGKVCYTIGIRSDIAGYYLDGVTFRYLIDPTVFENPNIATDYTILATSSTGESLYVYTENENSVRNLLIGEKMGFNSRYATYSLGDIGATSPSTLGRMEVSTTPIPLMRICLTPVESLETSSESLCYPFVFDSDHGSQGPDDGIVPNQSGIQTTYNTSQTSSQASLPAIDAPAENYAWIPNTNWNGLINPSTPAEGIGTVATTGCIENTCYTCEVLPTGDPQPTYVGISTLDRNVNEWLADDNPDGQENLLSAYVVMESTNKAFVITRNADPDNKIANPVEGMVVWDTTENCLKLYKVDATGAGQWSCVSQGCNQ